MNTFSRLVIVWLLISPGAWAESAFQITELLAVNASGLVTSEGDHADWIELRNATEESQNMEGWYLSDDPDNPTKWKASTFNVSPGAYLVIFASGKASASILKQEMSTNFTLGRQGGFLSLADPNGVVVQMIAYPEQRADIAYGLEASANGAYVRPTPHEANGVPFQGAVADTTFSVDRGFYSAAIEVEITTETEGAQIIYTTNGDIPSEGSIFTGPIGTLYEGPIRIDTTTVLRAVALLDGHLPTNIDTHTYIFPEQVLNQPEDPEGFPSRWVNFPADYAMDSRVINDPAYKDEAVSALTSLPAMSVVMGMDDLFGSRDGIYAHSTERGNAWERAASVELIHPDGSNGFQEDCGVRIHGFGWRPHEITAKHSLRLEFRERYGKTKLDYPLFEDAPVERFDSIVLRSQGSKGWQDFRDPEQTQYLHDAFARDTARDMGKIDGHATFVHLYLNGLYWGLYNPVERPDADFAAEYFGGSADEYDAINRRTTTNEAIDGDLVAYNEMIALAQGGIRSLEDYEAIQAYLDIDDLIDYMLIHQYTTNRDGPEEFNSNNMRGVRKREPRAPFRFFVWDMEYSLWNADRHINIDVAVPGSISFVYARLRESPEFRLRYADHVRRHLFNGGALTPEPVLRRWNERSDEIYSALIGESARWGDAKRPSQPYTRDIEWAAERQRLVEDYFPHRTGILVRQLRDAALYPKIQSPDFNQHGGRIDAGFQLRLSAGTLFNPERGDFYYTTDGSDPRVYGSGDISPTAVLVDKGTGVRLTHSAMIRARTYRDGEWSALNEATFVVGALPTAETLKISEIHYHPARPSEMEQAAGFDARSDFEFIELYNAGATPLDLTVLQFTRGLTLTLDGIAFPSLEPGATALLVRNKEAFTMRYGAGLPVIAEFESGKLNDGGETLSLSVNDGTLLHEIAYEDQSPWPESADGDGYSLSLIQGDGQTDLADPANWRASTAIGGSPGVLNWEIMAGSPEMPQVSLTSEVINLAGAEDVYWLIHIDKRQGQPEAIYQLEFSENLIDWRSSNTGYEVLEMSDDRDTYRSLLPARESAEGFIRIRVES